MFLLMITCMRAAFPKDHISNFIETSHFFAVKICFKSNRVDNKIMFTAH